jgi:hypothetical protein
MTLAKKIQAYLNQNNISLNVGDFKTGQPDGQEDQVLHWGTNLGTQPTQAQLDSAWATKVAADDAAAYATKRASEYPPMADYLDGIVKGNQAQVQTYIDACLAVKAKYPKAE